MVIGRTYAAALERGKSLNWDKEVAPQVRKSAIDEWIREARHCTPGTTEALIVSIRLHGHVTKLFERISGRQKRSLASKYLHFHVPEMFFIYDSRAAVAMRKLQPLLGGTREPSTTGDATYRVFAGQCRQLKAMCQGRFGITLNTRQLDNLLLQVHEDRAFR